MPTFCQLDIGKNVGFKMDSVLGAITSCIPHNDNNDDNHHYYHNKGETLHFSHFKLNTQKLALFGTARNFECSHILVFTKSNIKDIKFVYAFSGTVIAAASRQ